MPHSAQLKQQRGSTHTFCVSACAPAALPMSGALAAKPTGKEQEKGRVEVSRVRRYWPGKAPSWAEAAGGEEAVLAGNAALLQLRTQWGDSRERERDAAGESGLETPGPRTIDSSPETQGGKDQGL